MQDAGLGGRAARMPGCQDATQAATQAGWAGEAARSGSGAARPPGSLASQAELRVAQAEYPTGKRHLPA